MSNLTLSNVYLVLSLIADYQSTQLTADNTCIRLCPTSSIFSNQQGIRDLQLWADLSPFIEANVTWRGMAAVLITQSELLRYCLITLFGDVFGPFSIDLLDRKEGFVFMDMLKW